MVADALYGPFSRSNDYATPTEPPIFLQETTEDIEMKDSENDFEQVMLYYDAAVPSLGSGPISDYMSLDSNPIVGFD